MARVLFVNKASMNYPGGAETRIHAVATAWAKSGHQVYLICAKTSPSEAALEVLENVTVRRISVMPERWLSRFPVPHYLPQALFYLVSWPYILFYMRKWRISAVRDSMSPFPGLGVLAPWVGKRSVVVLHILYGGYTSWRKFYPPLYAVFGAAAERLLLRGWLRYRVMITDSPWLAAYIQKRGNKRLQVQAIENGIEMSRLALRPEKGEIYHLINAARFVEHKGQLELIHACRQLRAAGIQFSLHLYGAGPLAPLIRSRIAESRLGEFISIFPPLSHEQLLQRLREYDLYVMSSHAEGLPVVLLEAMAAQLPVVVPQREYATRLLTGELASFYDPSDPESLARQIAWAIQHPLEAEGRARLARQFVGKFTWERTAALEFHQLQAAGLVQ